MARTPDGAREQLREWAENYPPTFADKHTLVSAEIARLEKRDADALRLYEQAIHSAREHGFVQNEGLAHELAAQYCLARRSRNGRLRPSSERAELLRPLGRARQSKAARRTLPAPARGAELRRLRPRLARQSGSWTSRLWSKASQALSSEMVLPRLIEKLDANRGGARRGRAGLCSS